MVDDGDAAEGAASGPDPGADAAAQMNCATDTPPAGGPTLPELARRLCAGAVAISAATAAWLVLVAEFDTRRGWAVPGVDSCAHWLSWQCGLSLGTAREHVRVARALPDLPRLREELTAGRVSYAKARAIARVADSGTEAELLTLAEHCTASQLDRVVAGWRRADAATTSTARDTADQAAEQARTDAVAAGAEEADVIAAGQRAAADTWAQWWPEGADPEAERRAGPPQRFDWHENAEGTVTIQLRLSAEDAAEVIAAVEHRAEVLTRRDRTAGGSRPGESVDPPVDYPDWVAGDDQDRAAAARRGDGLEVAEARRARVTVARCSALLDLIRTGVGHVDTQPGDPARRELLVRVDAAVLADDLAAGQAALDGVTSLTAVQARRLACDAMVTTVLVDGHQVLACGRSRRYATAAQRRALLVRDGGCARPGCTETRAARLHAHHLRPWLHGGRTEVDNLVLLCDRCHGLVHELALDLRRDGGTLLALAPDGTRLWGSAEERPSDPAAARPLTTPTDLPPFWRANGERMDLAYVVDIMLGNRAAVRRQQAADSTMRRAAAA